MHLFLVPILLALISQTAVAELTANLRLHDSSLPFVTLDLQNTEPFPVAFLHWNLPFDKRFGGSDTFRVLREGQNVPYIGASVKYAQPAIGDYIFLAPNEVITVHFALHKLYDLSTPGVYSIQFDDYVLDYVNVNDIDSVPRLQENFSPSERVTSNIVKMWLTKPQPQPLRTPYPCSAGERTIINHAASQLIPMINRANVVIGSGQTPTYTEWFGVYTTGRWQIAEEVLRLIEGNNVVGYECDDMANVYAYVYPADTTHTIYVCSVFWNVKPIGGWDTQAGTLLHELSHFNNIGATGDWVYGTTGARNLARTNPERAVNNADNFEYFGESQFQ